MSETKKEQKQKDEKKSEEEKAEVLRLDELQQPTKKSSSKKIARKKKTPQEKKLELLLRKEQTTLTTLKKKEIDAGMQEIELLESVIEKLDKELAPKPKRIEDIELPNYSLNGEVHYKRFQEDLKDTKIVLCPGCLFPIPEHLESCQNRKCGYFNRELDSHWERNVKEYNIALRSYFKRDKKCPQCNALLYGRHDTMIEGKLKSKGLLPQGLVKAGVEVFDYTPTPNVQINELLCMNCHFRTFKGV